MEQLMIDVTAVLASFGAFVAWCAGYDIVRMVKGRTNRSPERKHTTREGGYHDERR